MDPNIKTKVVYTVIERPGARAFWTRIGVGWHNRDGSLALRLDAVPITGLLQVRDQEQRDDQSKPTGAADRPPLREVPRPLDTAGSLA
jgi:hypothetical protein